MVVCFRGDKNFLNDLKNKKAPFLLACSTTKTCEIEGITQAGIPGLIHLTPTLDSEFLCEGEVKSLKDLAKTPKGVPTPALITRAVSLKSSFSLISILDIGMAKKPIIKKCQYKSFGITPSNRIDKGADILAKEVFEKGRNFAKKFKTDKDFIILGETTPAGTTTAYATSLALGYDSWNLFSSSFKNDPKSIKDEVVKRALSLIKKEDNIFDILSKVSDNMLIFSAGFAMEASLNKKVILGGGTQMAAVMMIIDRLLNSENANVNNIALATTKWVYEDKNSNIEALLDMLSFTPNAFFGDFSFKNSKLDILKLYDKGEAKEGVGAGAAIVYGYTQGLKEDDIVKGVEELLGA